MGPVLEMLSLSCLWDFNNLNFNFLFFTKKLSEIYIYTHCLRLVFTEEDHKRKMCMEVTYKEMFIRQIPTEGNFGSVPQGAIEMM